MWPKNNGLISFYRHKEKEFRSTSFFWWIVLYDFFLDAWFIYALLFVTITYTDIIRYIYFYPNYLTAESNASMQDKNLRFLGDIVFPEF